MLALSALPTAKISVSMFLTMSSMISDDAANEIEEKGKYEKEKRYNGENESEDWEEAQECRNAYAEEPNDSPSKFERVHQGSRVSQ